MKKLTDGRRTPSDGNTSHGLKNDETRGSWIKAAFNNNATALWWPSWWESVTAGHNFGRGPSNDYSIKVWF